MESGLGVNARVAYRSIVKDRQAGTARVFSGLHWVCLPASRRTLARDVGEGTAESTWVLK